MAGPRCPTPGCRRGATAALWANATGPGPVNRGLTTPRIEALRLRGVECPRLMGGVIAAVG